MRAIFCILSARTLAVSAAAQAVGVSGTIGVPGVNDYIVDGAGSGSSSCAIGPVALPPGSLVPLSVTTLKAGISVVFVINLSPLLCIPEILPLAPCGPIPTTFLDIDPGGPFISFAAVTDLSGTATFLLATPPALGLTVATQALMIVPATAPCPGPFVATQAYEIGV